jgi:hypothetical protein
MCTIAPRRRRFVAQTPPQSHRDSARGAQENVAMNVAMNVALINRIPVRMACLALFLALSAGASQAQLEGIIDEHTHSDPDNVARRYDALEVAREAKAAGMAGLVLKNHEMPTTQLAYTVSEVVPGIRIWGSIVLNRSVGGINPDAVLQQATVKGNFLKVVFMPTVDAQNPKNIAAGKPFVPVQKNGVLLPETIEVMKLVQKYDLVLATGHVEPQDALLLVSEARKMGLRRVLVTHPPLQGTTIAQMQQEVKDGAYLEFIGNTILPIDQAGAPTTVPVSDRRKPSEWADDIHAVGAEHCILSGDFGGTKYPPFIEGWKMYLAALKGAGVTDAELDIMARKNPARLLGVDDATSAK